MLEKDIMNLQKKAAKSSLETGFKTAFRSQIGRSQGGKKNESFGQR